MVRVPPFRGDTVASGVVALGTLVTLLEVRMGWSGSVQLAVVAARAAVVGALLAGCPRQSRPYVSAIVVTFLVLWALTVGRLAQVLGGNTGGGTLTWTLLLFGLVAAAVAVRYDASAATLGAGLALVRLPLAVADWVADPSEGAKRTVLLVSVVALGLITVSHRDRRPAHAAQLANAAGAGLGLIAAQQLTYGAVMLVLRPGVGHSVFEFGRSPSLGTGWELAVLAGGLGLLAYGAVDRQRGPVLVGLALLLTFVATAATGDDGVRADTLIGWPLLLGAGAAGLLVIGLRPTTPAGPEPAGAPDPPAPLPLR